MVLIAEREGLFGPVAVVDSFPVRKVFASGHIQGAALLIPSAPEVCGSSRPGPGPLLDTVYQHVWLLAAGAHPYGVGLMLGLGCGAGASALLYQFPDLRLDVVEVDPVMADLARAHFPLVEHFERESRLRLVIGDALEFVGMSHTCYDFVLVDIDGGPVRDVLLSPVFQDALVDLSAERWVNVIAAQDDVFLRNLMRLLDSRGGLREVYSSVPFESWLPLRRNWILTTAAICPQSRNLTPFSHLNGRYVDKTRAVFRDVLRTRLTREQSIALWRLDQE